ncbi:uncharacterized protein EV422DRAFT_119394 [Fimicolochytrium jonesii]|uniref:uncharacterized protein n=1 Tax=Fimicolochytrium jonesii TaxID=1396493 RepID=UPI0022FDE3EE|nr:uncharacterized protein EV422DRAFT_119394 [Fimicolochytrium jonesii]KAI8819149.1 hypothetical protein EV422DRAFT_119394 [Fimicolochytrium jonesii]
MFALLNSRPQRRVYNGLDGQAITPESLNTLSTEQQQPPSQSTPAKPPPPSPYFISHCTSTTFDLPTHTATQITLERCSNGTAVDFARVLTTVDVIHCHDVRVTVRNGAAGTVLLDECSDVVVSVPGVVDANGVVGEGGEGSGWTIYTTRCSGVKIGEYFVPGDVGGDAGDGDEGENRRVWRLKTWVKDGMWTTARANLYGDVVEPLP